MSFVAYSSPHDLFAALPPHPCPLCESTTLSSVRSRLPPVALACPLLRSVSRAQCDAAAAAIAALRAVGAFALGDGTGVGKGRVLSACLLEWAHLHPGARLAWISANSSLAASAAQELETAGMPDPSASVAFASYSGVSLCEARRRSLREWLAAGPPSAPALVVLDECHLLRNLGRSHAALAEALRGDVRLLFSSATVMSEPRHVEYLSYRLGLHGRAGAPFSTAKQCAAALRTGGAPLMELVSAHLKREGLYVSRHLSLAGVDMRVATVRTTREQRRTYDACADALAKAETGSGAAQRLLLRLLPSLKVEAAVRLGEEALARGETVVFCVVSTGEASSRRRMAAEAAGARCAAGTGPAAAAAPGPLSSFAECLHDEGDDDDPACSPADAVDALLAHFGWDAVAELTGRRARFELRSGAWTVARVPRGEAEAFQSGRKRVAVLSRAGGIGLSLNDIGAAGRRHCVLLEFPWSATELVQMMGRVHRSSNATAPAYTLLCTDLPAERRVLQAMCRRLSGLGSLARGDSRACDPMGLIDAGTPTYPLVARRSFQFRAVAAWALARATAAQLEDLRLVVRTSADGDAPVPREEVLRALREVDEEEGAPPSPDKLRSVAPLLRHELTALLVDWSPSTHALFAPSCRAWVRSVLAAHRCAEAAGTLGLLPDAILHLVVREAVRAPAAALRRYAEAVAAAGGGAALLAAVFPHERLLNAALRLPVAAQEELLLHADHLLAAGGKGAAKRRLPAPLEQIATERAGKGILAAVERVDASAEDGTLLARVGYAPEPEGPPPPKEGGCAFWEAGRTVVWSVDGRTGRTADGRAVALTEAHAPSTRRRYAAAVARRRERLRKRCASLPTTFAVATHRALLQWEESTQRVAIVRLGDGTSVLGLWLGCE